MTIEKQLKDLILQRYHSIREFTINIDMPYTTIDSIFRRGIGNSSVTNIIKICKALGISADALADGKIVMIESPELQAKKPMEIEDVISNTADTLTNGLVTLDGNTIERDDINKIINAMELSLEMVKREKP